jgi:uncharacterized protein (TIGR00251 family)
LRARPSPPDAAFLERGSESLLLHLHVVPGASRTELAGLHGDRLKIRIKAKATEGAANRELLRFLAELFDLAPSTLEIVRGATDRRKTVRLPPGADVSATIAREPEKPRE